MNQFITLEEDTPVNVPVDTDIIIITPDPTTYTI